MYLCDDHHEEICYEKDKCPMCKLTENFEREIKDLEAEINELELEISRLENKIEELEDTNK